MVKSKQLIILQKKKLELSNLKKVYWPEIGYTKGDMIAYYDEVCEFILPYLKDRPLTLHRFPDGIDGKSFFQKDVGSVAPDWMKTFPQKSEDDKVVHYTLCNDKATLIYLANWGCIELHPWNATKHHPQKPDYMVFDLDPGSVGFKKLIEVTLFLKEILDRIGLPNFCKTSGKSGLHIMVPAKGRYSFEQIREFCKAIYLLVHREFPQWTSLERSPSKRRDKIYLDYLQNRQGQTMACAYSLRPTPKATVSTPLDWSEVTPRLKPEAFTLVTLKQRLTKTGDLWQGVLGKGFDMKAALDKLEREF